MAQWCPVDSRALRRFRSPKVAAAAAPRGEAVAAAAVAAAVAAVAEAAAVA